VDRNIPLSLPPLIIGDLTVPVCIIQGGMGIGVSLSSLAGAVAEAGGIGVIATAGIGWDEPDFRTKHAQANSRALARHIRAVRERTDGVLGINIMVALTNYEQLVETACEEGADIIFSGAGLPMSLPKLVENAPKPPKIAPIVSSGRAAQLICRKWARQGRLPDLVVVEGPLAGGHLGFKADQVDDEANSLESLVPDVVAAVAPFAEESGTPIPVIAAGGIYTGADILKYLEMGAGGVQMGTRFVATHECDAASDFKQAYLDATPEDLALVKSPVGLPGRAIRNIFIERSERGEAMSPNCPYKCLRVCDYKAGPFCISEALIAARQGDRHGGLVFAGANAHRVDCLMSVQELFDELNREYDEAVAGPPA
jgi:nitronate monooxygenase